MLPRFITERLEESCLVVQAEPVESAQDGKTYWVVTLDKRYWPATPTEREVASLTDLAARYGGQHVPDGFDDYCTWVIPDNQLGEIQVVHDNDVEPEWEEESDETLTTTP